MNEENINSLDGENIFEKIQELAGQVGDHYSVLEEKIDVRLQMQYFRFSRAVKKRKNQGDVMLQVEDLKNQDLPDDVIKTILVKLASVENVEAYRAIEHFAKNPKPGLRDWAILALQESRMLLESSLLDENQVFISSGLGGKGQKLRYFIILVSKKGNFFSDYQKRLIESEFETSLKKHQGEIEEIVHSDRFSTLLALIPLTAPLRDIFKEAVDECNEYGNFLMENFLITNIKTFSQDEISSFFDSEGNFSPETPDNKLPR